MEIGQDLLSHCSTLCSRTYDTTIVCKVPRNSELKWELCQESTKPWKSWKLFPVQIFLDNFPRKFEVTWMVFYKHVLTPMQTLQSKKIWYLSPSVQISKLLPPFFLYVNHSNWQSDIWINTTNFRWSWFWFNFHLFIWELKTVTFLHGKENYLFVNQGAYGKKTSWPKVSNHYFFTTVKFCQLYSIW